MKKYLCLLATFLVLAVCCSCKHQNNEQMIFEPSCDLIYDTEILSDEEASSFCEKYGFYDTSLISDADGAALEDVLITSVAHDKAGVAYATGIENYGDGHVLLYVIEDGRERDCIRIDDVFDNSLCFVFGTEHGFENVHLFKENVLYSMDIDSMTCIPVLDLGAAGIELYDAPITFDNGSYVMMGSSGDIFKDEESSFGLWRITPKELSGERQTVRVGVCRYHLEWIEDEINEFNRTNEDYVIEVIHYEDDPLTMRTDILMSDGPDILIYGNDYRSELEGADIFAELDDVITDSDRFFPNLWDACRTDEGKRVWVTPYVTVECLFAMPGSFSHDLSFEDWSSFTGFVSLHSSCEHILRGDTSQGLTQEILPFLLNKAYKERELSESDVASLLEFCKAHGSSPYTETTGVAVQMTGGELMFLEVYGGVGSFLQYVLTNEYTGGSIDYIGYPFAEGPVFNTDLFFSVLDSSNNPDGAACVLNYLLSDEALTADTVNRLNYLPISKTACEANIQQVLGYYEDNRITDTEIYFSNSSGSGGISLPVLLQSAGDGDMGGEPSYDPNNVYRRAYGPAGRTLIDDPEDYIDDYYEFIGSAQGMLLYDQGVMDICNEELGGYFDGSRSIDDVSNVIASRVKIFIDEDN